MRLLHSIKLSLRGAKRRGNLLKTQMASLALVMTPLLPLPAQAQPDSVQLEHTKAMLVTEHTAIDAAPFRVGVVLEAKDGWHTYWQNPGDAGIPTELKWTLPEGFSSSPIDWPVPVKLTEGPLVTFSYPGVAFLPVTITPGKIDAGSSYPISVKAQWLVCKDICVPESADLQITLPAGTPALSPSAPLFAEHDAQKPQPLAASLGFTSADKHISVSLPLNELHATTITSAFFFPRELNIFTYAAEQTLSFENKDAPTLSLAVEELPTTPQSGILVLQTDQGEKRFDVTLAPATAAAAAGTATPTATAAATSPITPPAPTATNDISAPGYGVILLLALMGGLVLNLMPCVLPVLSLKALSIAQKSGRKHEHVVRHGVAYTLGILVSFGIIAGVLIGLRDSGEAIGWGYQMQSPAFVGFLIYLLFMVGLSLSGLFHLPVVLGGVGSDITREASTRGSFLTGMLATAVATPCTAPFMASAVGAALTLPAWQALLVFETLGFGLALPFLLISIFPQLRHFLPKPGAWMDVFKQLLAFPMYGSVIWLMWVLTLQTGAGGMVVAMTGMLLIVLVLWMKPLFDDGSRAYSFTALCLYLLILAFSLPMLAGMEPATAGLPGGHAEHGVNTIDYSKDKLEELRKAGKPVFVDATAAWCITCQVNARVALHTPRVMEEFNKRGITLMIADWTRRNDDITDFLSGFGYKGVPLCVFYPPNQQKPVVLPQILTEDTVINVITQGE